MSNRDSIYRDTERIKKARKISQVFVFSKINRLNDTQILIVHFVAEIRLSALLSSLPFLINSIYMINILL